MIHLLIPNFNEIFSLVSLLTFIIINISLGHLITQRKTFSTNFFVGYSVFFIFILFFYLFSNQIYLIKFYYLYLFIAVVIFLLHTKKLKNYLIYLKENIKKNQIVIIILIPLFLIILNHKAIGWDSFTHWMPMAQKMINYQVEVSGHANYYPIGSTIIPFVSSLYTNQLIENSYALYGFFLLVLLFNIYSRDSNFYTSTKTRIFVNLFIVFYVFFNPGILNKFIYTSYADFSLGVILLVLLTELNKFDNSFRSILSISLISILLINIKNTGFVLLVLILFAFIISSKFYFKLKLKKLFLTYKNLSIPLFFSIIFLIIWRLYLNLGEVDNSDRIIRFTDYFERYDVFKFFLKKVYSQIFDRKIFFFVTFSIPLLLIFFKKIININTKILLFSSFLIFSLWNLFLIFMYFVWFAAEEMKGANSYWRYNMILAPVIFYSLIIFFKDIHTKILNFDSIRYQKLISIFLIFLIIVLPINFIEKIRRDLFYPNIPSKFYKIEQKNINKAFYYGGGANLQSVRASYYLSENFNFYKDRVTNWQDINLSSSDEKNEDVLIDKLDMQELKKSYDLIILNYNDNKNKWIYKKY